MRMHWGILATILCVFAMNMACDPRATAPATATGTTVPSDVYLAPGAMNLRSFVGVPEDSSRIVIAYDVVVPNGVDALCNAIEQHLLQRHYSRMLGILSSPQTDRWIRTEVNRFLRQVWKNENETAIVQVFITQMDNPIPTGSVGVQIEYSAGTKARAIVGEHKRGGLSRAVGP